MARLAVSAVTCRQAETRMPFSGWFLMKSLRMICRTFIDWLAQSIRFLPISARAILAISPATRVVVVDIISCFERAGLQPCRNKFRVKDFGPEYHPVAGVVFRTGVSSGFRRR